MANGFLKTITIQISVAFEQSRFLQVAVGNSTSDSVTVYDSNTTTSLENYYYLSMNPVTNLRFITIDRTVDGYMAVCEVKVYVIGNILFPYQ